MSAMSIGIIRLAQTSIGKKVIMAVTGMIGVGFVIFHMYGNLKAFEFMTGPEYASAPQHFDEYAHTLRTFGEPIFGYSHLLWGGRLILMAAVILHAWAALSLTRESQKARPSQYTQHKKLKTNFASLYIRVGGTILFFFIIFHLMHFTWGVPGLHPNFIPGQAYHNMVAGFQSYGFAPAIIYIIVMVVLGLHLYHGTWSAFQTLGLNNKTYTQFLRAVAAVIAVVVTIGFIIVPVAVILGIVS
jgi:succinate dehydrogenase / fumarate reductase cytochrome b subunit